MARTAPTGKNSRPGTAIFVYRSVLGTLVQAGSAVVLEPDQFLGPKGF